MVCCIHKGFTGGGVLRTIVVQYHCNGMGNAGLGGGGGKGGWGGGQNARKKEIFERAKL